MLIESGRATMDELAVLDGLLTSSPGEGAIRIRLGVGLGDDV